MYSDRNQEVNVETILLSNLQTIGILSTVPRMPFTAKGNPSSGVRFSCHVSWSPSTWNSP